MTDTRSFDAVVKELEQRLDAAEAERDRYVSLLTAEEEDKFRWLTVAENAMSENTALRAQVEKSAHWLAHGPKLRAALENLTAPMGSATRNTGVCIVTTLVVAGDDAMDRYRAAMDALAASEEPKP